MNLLVLLACAHETALEHALDVDTATLPPSVTAARGADGRWTVTVSWSGPGADLRWTGDFVGWGADGVPLVRGPDGVARATAVMDDGVHRYKLIVDGAWVPDPANPVREDDGFQGQNSLLRLGRAAHYDQITAPAGAVELGGIEHDPLRSSDLAQVDGGVRVRVRTLRADAEAVTLRAAGGRWPMSHAGTGVRSDVWEVVAPLGPDEPYTLEVADGGRPVALPDAWTTPSVIPSVRSPGWSHGAVWYQVFPDRHRNGDPANDPPGVRPWGEDFHAPEAEAGVIWGRHYGGDLAGIRADLPRLKALGVDAVYLNPVWASGSPHRYDATSWVHVDPELGDGAALPTTEDLLDPSTWTFTGSDRQLLALVADAHALGLRVVLDGVFNHVGKLHPAYQDLLTRGRASPYAGWFHVTSWEPLTVEGWAGYPDLPVLADGPDGYLDPAVEAHVLAVTRRWLDPNADGDPSDGIDGWRLDVADEVPAAFWRRWRAEVARVSPEAVVLGEIWAGADAWVTGDTFHGVTAYGWAGAVLGWANGESTAAALDAQLTDLRAAWPEDAAATSWTLVDSHDTDRLASRLYNPGRGFDQRNRPNLDPTYRTGRPDADAYARARLAAWVQATAPGSPLIWYGDERGLWGADDPDCRRPMPWPDAPTADPIDAAQERAWAEIFGLRSTQPALRTGAYHLLLADADRWLFTRTTADGAVLVALNRGAEPATFDLDRTGWEPINGQPWGTIPPRGAALWRRDSPAHTTP